MKRDLVEGFWRLDKQRTIAHKTTMATTALVHMQ
nr:MAG TPA: hypothetical protein [Caudoviricetes sp.]